MRALLLVMAVACSGSSSAPSTGRSSGGSTATGSAVVPADDASATITCIGPAPSSEHKCIQDCGGPVVRDTDPPPEWRWLSSAEAASREQHGCPKCLPPDARIATPTGERSINELTVGSPIITFDETGRQVEGHVLHVGFTWVTGSHELVRITLADGRVVAGSAGHPDRAGRLLGALATGDLLGGSPIVRVERLPYPADRTWDVLPSGPTGLYVVNGVALRSTFFHPR